jgi:hypothetical protein
MQPADVMAAVQRMRAEAFQAGNLQTTREINATELMVADVAGADNSAFDNLIDWHSPECQPYFLCYSFPPKERRCH